MLEILILIVVICIVVSVPVILFIKYSKVGEGNKKQYKSMSDQSIKVLEEKKQLSKEALEQKGFKIYREYVSPVETINGYDSVKILTLDLTNFNMALTSLTTASKGFFQQIYDIRNLIEVILIVNDEVYDENKEYKEVQSIKLDIRAKDSINPRYFIGLLPKTVANPERKFEEDFLEYSVLIKNELNKIVKKNIK
ncbi:MAG: hypothetical protein RSB51_05280 [Clostridia bacterium]